MLAGTVAGLAVVMGFLTWAASGRDLPFPVSNQFAGTLSLATPLVFGALCGVLCERSGVVNVSIEGQFLSAAFAAAVVGSLTQSVAGGHDRGRARRRRDGRAAGSVLDQLPGQPGRARRRAQPAGGRRHRLPVRPARPAGVGASTTPRRCSSRSRFPGLSKIPFFGRVLFEQNILAYLAAISVLVVWLMLFRTTWGLRIRLVGEHPEAADTVGISVRGIRWSAVLAGGVFGRSRRLLLHPRLDRARSPRSSPSATGSSRWPR